MKVFYSFLFWTGIIESIIELLKKIPSWVWGGLGLLISLFALNESKEILIMIFSTSPPPTSPPPTLPLLLPSIKQVGKFMGCILLYSIGEIMFLAIFGEKIFPKWMREKEIDLLLYMVGTMSIAYFFFWW